MRVVVDTNVLISAAFRDRLPEDVIMFLVTHPDFEWITTEKILQEYPDVLHRKKFSLAESLIQKWEQMVEEGIHVVPDSIVVAFPRDQKDAKFHSCALSAEGYITEFSAPGPDGGVDILAGGGTLGFQEPRLCVQVKSSQSPAHYGSPSGDSGIKRRLQWNVGGREPRKLSVFFCGGFFLWPLSSRDPRRSGWSD